MPENGIFGGCPNCTYSNGEHDNDCLRNLPDLQDAGHHLAQLSLAWHAGFEDTGFTNSDPKEVAAYQMGARCRRSKLEVILAP